MKYKKKPVEIEAFVYKENKTAPDWFKDKIKDGTITTYVSGACTIKTLEGEMKSSPGDYIIKGIKGEIYACKPDIFEETYECVEDSKADTIRAINGKLKDIIMDRIRQYDSQSSSHSTKLYRRYEAVRCLITLISGNKIKGTIKTEEEYSVALRILGEILPSREPYQPTKLPSEILGDFAQPQEGESGVSVDDLPFLEEAQKVVSQKILIFNRRNVAEIHFKCMEILQRARRAGLNPKIFPVYFEAGCRKHRINEDGQCEQLINNCWIPAF